MSAAAEDFNPTLRNPFRGLPMARPAREPVAGEVWSVKAPVGREHLYRNLGTRRVVAVTEGLVTYWAQGPNTGGSLPGVKQVYEFCRECEPLVRCPTCWEPADTDSDPCPTCWGKADSGDLL